MWPNARRDHIHKATVFVFFFFLFAQSLISWNTIKRARFGPVHIYVSEQDAERELTELKPASMHHRIYAINRTASDKSNARIPLDTDRITSQKAPDGDDFPRDKAKSDLKAYTILSTRLEDVKTTTSETLQNISNNHRGRKIKVNLDANTNFGKVHQVLKTLRSPIVSKPSPFLGGTVERRANDAEVGVEGNKHLLHPKITKTFSTLYISRNSSKDVNSSWLGPWGDSEKSVPTNISLRISRFSAKTVDIQIAKESLSRKKIIELEAQLRETLQATRMHCPVTPPNLAGRISVTVHAMKGNFPEVELGGRWRPSHCKANHRVAIIIPYRDRSNHLATLLTNLHPLLQKQQLDYGIYVVEMAHPIPFNRGLLMNVGFEEARLLEDYQCYIFHDVDLIPEDDRNLYTCPDKNTPRHMSVAVSSMHYRLPYGSIFGGVSAMTKEQFLAVNGFSNLYFGWGGEDDDLSKRLRQKGYRISRYSPEVARYTMLRHEQQSPNPNRWKLLQKRGKSVSEEGLSTLQYRLLKRELRDLYTWIYVDVEKKEIILFLSSWRDFLAEKLVKYTDIVAIAISFCRPYRN